jgi:hypothetical protein
LFYKIIRDWLDRNERSDFVPIVSLVLTEGGTTFVGLSYQGATIQDRIILFKKHLASLTATAYDSDTFTDVPLADETRMQLWRFGTDVSGGTGSVDE